MPTVKLEFTAYQGMCEGSQAEGSLGQSVRAVSQTKLAEYIKKKIEAKISCLGFFHIVFLLPSHCTHQGVDFYFLGHYNVPNVSLWPWSLMSMAAAVLFVIITYNE